MLIQNKLKRTVHTYNTPLCVTSQQHALRPSSFLHHSTSSVGGAGIGAGLESRQSQAASFKLTRGRSSSAARYLQTTTTTTTTTHYQQPATIGLSLPTPPHQHYHSSKGPPRVFRHGVRPSVRRSRGSYSNETQEEVQEEDEATLRELLLRSVLPP